MDDSQYRQLKRRAEMATAEAAEARGALKQAMQQLEQEHGCKTIKAAERKLQTLQEQERKAEQDLNAAIAAYTEEYGND